MYVTYDETWNEDFQREDGKWIVLEECPSPTNTATYIKAPEKACEIEDRGIAVLYEQPEKCQILEISEEDFLNRKRQHDDDIFESWSEIMEIIADKKEEKKGLIEKHKLADLVKAVTERKDKRPIVCIPCEENDDDLDPEGIDEYFKEQGLKTEYATVKLYAKTMRDVTSSHDETEIPWCVETNGCKVFQSPYGTELKNCNVEMFNKELVAFARRFYSEADVVVNADGGLKEINHVDYEAINDTEVEGDKRGMYGYGFWIVHAWVLL